MTNYLLGALVAFTMCTAIECYLLLGRVQLLMTYLEQLLQVGARLLAALPGKSAGRTVTPQDLRPMDWFPKLRLLAELRDRLAERYQAPADVADEDLVDEELVDVDETGHDDIELDRWADDGGHVDVEHEDEPAPDPPIPPVLGPATVPAARVLLQHAFDPDGPTAPEPELDDVDRKLARFTYAEGHRR